MMPLCRAKHCKKAAEVKVAMIYDDETVGLEPLYLCKKHAKKFCKKYNLENLYGRR